ncbi:F0F1 ATP synthase subunit B [Candidatus Saccharibacteria bacterium]|nr:F0F1 ATP synthase subunit B [Candidatus Saccharibacteria bacterium]MBH2007016.1 F0F1 ATP synthase subunit B [Candidatus Saccharibacteria bacterium]
MNYYTQLTVLASTPNPSSEGDILSALGIDWTLLAIQLVAFLVLVWVLGKFVYPVFLRIIDERQDKIEASVKAAEAAEQKAESAQDEVAKLLKEARKEAREIVTTAKDEATAMISASDEKAKARAEKIVVDAHDQLEKDIVAARKALHNDTIELVALATEKVVGSLSGSKLDKQVIETAVKETK